MLMVNFQVVVKENKFMDDREYSFDALLRSLRKLGQAKELSRL